MKRLLNVTVLLLIVLAGLAGCDEFWQKGDQIIQDVNAVGGGAKALLESPAGQLIPPDLKVYGLIAIGLINAGVIGWEEMRARQMKKITKAIVRGLENPLGNPDKVNAEIKSDIKDEMLKQGGDKFYAKANKIVDQLKIS